MKHNEVMEHQKTFYAQCKYMSRICFFVCISWKKDYDQKDVLSFRCGKLIICYFNAKANEVKYLWLNFVNKHGWFEHAFKKKYKIRIALLN